MARTPGSGWGGGVMFYQVCPICGKKKALWDPIEGIGHYKPFRCIAKNCVDEFGHKNRFDSDTLLRIRYATVAIPNTKQTTLK